MEHRVESPTWLDEDAQSTSLPETENPDGAASGLDSTAQVGPLLGDTPPEAVGAEPGFGEEEPPQMPGMAHPPMPAETGSVPDGYGMPGPAAGPAAGMQMPDPFAPPAPSRGPVGTITAPFAALTKGRSKKAPKSEQNGRYAPQDFRAAGPAPAAMPQAAPTRRAQLVLARIEPWSVMKFSFLISLVGWVVLFVAVSILYYALSKLGVFHAIESTVGQVTSGKGSAGTNAASWFAASRVLGYTMLAGAINVVLITALATVGAVVYNLVTHLAGGIEVTLKETD